MSREEAFKEWFTGDAMFAGVRGAFFAGWEAGQNAQKQETEKAVKSVPNSWCGDPRNTN